MNVDEVTSRFATVTADSQQIASDLSDAVTLIGNNQTAISNNHTSLTASISANTTAITTNNAALDTRVTTNATAITTLTNSLAAEVQRLEGLINDLTTTVQNNSTADATQAQADADARDVLDAKIASNDADISALQTEAGNNTTNLAALQVNVGSNDSDIAALQTAVTDNDSDIAALQTAVTGNDSDISTLQGLVTGLRTDLDANTALDAQTKASIEQQIADLESALGTNTGNIESLQATATSLQNQINANTDLIQSDVTYATDPATGDLIPVTRLVVSTEPATVNFPLIESTSPDGNGVISQPFDAMDAYTMEDAYSSTFVDSVSFLEAARVDLKWSPTNMSVEPNFSTPSDLAVLLSDPTITNRFDELIVQQNFSEQSITVDLSERLATADGQSVAGMLLIRSRDIGYVNIEYDGSIVDSIYMTASNIYLYIFQDATDPNDSSQPSWQFTQIGVSDAGVSVPERMIQSYERPPYSLVRDGVVINDLSSYAAITLTKPDGSTVNLPVDTHAKVTDDRSTVTVYDGSEVSL